jgi:biotin synthase
MHARIKELRDQVLADRALTAEQALELFAHPDREGLLAAANQIREIQCGDDFDLCSILNAKSGRCEEDCTYCAQSSHYETAADVYPLVEPEVALKMAKENEAAGVHRFSLVTSGKGVSKEDFPAVVETYRLLRAETELALCASLGIIGRDEFRQLAEQGVTTIHHNLETGPKHFGKVCTTHTYGDRVATILAAQAEGLSVCSGGIIGMGESVQDRIEMFLDLRALGVKSVPINILNPIEGTPLHGTDKLTPDEILRTIAIARFILPNAKIRLAGGRDQLGDEVPTALHAGVNAALTGNYLTTVGSDIAQDKVLVSEAGFDISKKEASCGC